MPAQTFYDFKMAMRLYVPNASIFLIERWVKNAFRELADRRQWSWQLIQGQLVWQDARDLGWSREPVVEVLIPSTLDDSLAPEGQHVASLFCQHVAPELPDGTSWDDHREQVADLMIATVDRFAPGFATSVIGRQALSPLDLERQFGLLGGDIFHGALTLNQLFSARPMLGHADYRGPLKGLYHCGSGAHPGGGVTGAPGHNAARTILGDHRALFG